MPYYKFGPDDIFSSRIKAHPQYTVTVFNSRVFLNQYANITGSYTSTILGVPSGSISLYEKNVNRDIPLHDYDPNTDTGTSTIIYPWVYSQNSQTFKKYLKNTIVEGYQSSLFPNKKVHGEHALQPFGNIITGSYPLSASIVRTLTDVDTISIYAQPFSINRKVSALANVARKYAPLSKHFVFVPTGDIETNRYAQGLMYPSGSNAGYFGADTTFLTRNLTSMANVNMIEIPQIYFGSTIKKGSVNLKFYITGSVVGECSDYGENGELIETTGSTVVDGTGSVVGIVMYDEGIIILTGSETLDTGPSPNITYTGGGLGLTSKWIYFGSGLNDGDSYDHTIQTASFGLEFKGTNYVDTMTMFCHAKKGDLNHSNNPTFKKYSDAYAFNDITSSQYSFTEREYGIKNLASSSYVGTEENFQKTTYLSKVAIYDEDGNIIAVASTATPVKKTDDTEYTFKLKLDI